MNDMFKNEDEEDSYDNNKYLMSNEEEKDIKIGTTNENENENENEIKNEILNHEINTEDTNQIIPVIQYKSSLEKENNIEKEYENENHINIENILSNDLEEAKMSIKNFLKEKISKQYNKTENNEKDNYNINNISNENEKDKNNIDMNNYLTQVQVSNSSLSKGLNNMVINSSRTSGESMGNSIDNYIKMENLYLQDGKINSTVTNIDNSNTNNNNITTNNNSNLPTNKKSNQKNKN